MRTFIFGGTVAEETTILELNQFYLAILGTIMMQGLRSINVVLTQNYIDKYELLC